MNRRTFLQSSAAVGSAALLPRLARPARAASVLIDVPTVDQVVVQEVTDGDHNIFLRPSETSGLTVRRTGMTDAAQGRTLRSEWGWRCTSSRMAAANRAAICSISASRRRPMPTISNC